MGAAEKLAPTMLDAALAHAAAGRAVLPCHASGPKFKAPHYDKNDFPNGVLDATTDPKKITAWWTRWPDALIGIACGAISNCVVLDLDDKPDRPSGFVTVPDFNDYGAPMVKSPTGQGLHLYFAYSEGCENLNFPGAEVKSNSVYVIAPPSGGWKWLTGVEPDWSSLPPLPERFRNKRARGANVVEVPAWLEEYAKRFPSNLGNSNWADDDTFGAATVEEVKAALAVIDPDITYPDWVRVIAACKDRPFELVDEWCATGEKYKGTRATLEKFESCKAMSAVNEATLFHYAYEADPDWRDNIVQPDDENLDVQNLKADAPVASPAMQAFIKAGAPAPKPSRIKTSGEFVADFVPPNYLIHGIVLQRNLYSLTAPTGTSKTTVTLRIIFHVARGIPILGRKVKQCRVLFLAGENPDDVIMKWKLLCAQMDADPDDMDVCFLPLRISLKEKGSWARLKEETLEAGPFGLVVVDTAAAYNEVADENSNAEMTKQAAKYRELIDQVHGNPTIIVTCHPVKNYNPEELSPRGGGGFVNEMDTNLVLIKDAHNSPVTKLHWHVKKRGIDFEPLAFRIEPGQTETLKDVDGEMLWNVTARPIEGKEHELIERDAVSDQDRALAFLVDTPSIAYRKLAERLGWTPYRAEKTLKAIKKGKLADDKDGAWKLSKAGKARLADLEPEPDDGDVETPQGRFKSI